MTKVECDIRCRSNMSDFMVCFSKLQFVPAPNFFKSLLFFGYHHYHHPKQYPQKHLQSGFACFAPSPHPSLRSTFGSFSPRLRCHLGHPFGWPPGSVAQRSPGWHRSPLAAQRLQPVAAAGPIPAAMWSDALAPAVDGRRS